MKSNIYVILLAGAIGAIGVTTLATKLTAADAAMPGCSMGGCCGGAADSATVATTKATPDLLTTCPVSGEKLGEMGKPYTFTYQEQEVKLCCKGCKKDFDKTPDKYLKVIRAADAEKK